MISRGTGTASVVLCPDRESVSYSLTYLDLSDRISVAGWHFHTGAKGVKGGQVKLIVPPDAPAAFSVNGIWRVSDAGPQPLTSATIDSFVAGKIYINLHTGSYIGGEIRRQLTYDFEMLTSIPDAFRAIPAEFHLEQNFPNPFNPSTIIRFELSRASTVTLTVYNILGQTVGTLFQGEKPAGIYETKFDASGLASGVYFYRLQAGGLVQAKKSIFAK